jgi:Tfp pilus assembly protein PilF
MKRIIILLLSLALAAPLFASASGKVRAGNRLYKKARYDRSLEQYREAEISSPQNPVIRFNIGDALYKTGDFEASSNEFRRALASRDPRVRGAAYYNLGNAAFRADKTDEALEYYKKALAVNPNDMDAKYNIEYILHQKNDPQKQKGAKDEKNGTDKKDQQKNGREGKENGPDKQNAGGNDKKQGISKEDAERIMQYYNDSDKNAARKRKMAPPQLPKVEEDW